MAQSLNYTWYIFCSTEGTFKIVNQKVKPTTCPDNSSHSIDDSKSTYSVALATPDLLANTATQGYYSSEGISFVCAPNVVTSYDRIFPYDVCVLNGKMIIEDSNQGDSLDILVTPSLTIGTVTQNAVLGDTKLYCNDTVINYSAKGIYLTINNETDRYYVKSVGFNDSSVILTSPLVKNYLAGSSIQRTVEILKNFTIPSKSIIPLGESNPTTTFIPAGFVIRFVYTNKSIVSKSFNFLLSYF